jgi:hypothetical protein
MEAEENELPTQKQQQMPLTVYGRTLTIVLTSATNLIQLQTNLKAYSKETSSSAAHATVLQLSHKKRLTILP